MMDYLLRRWVKPHGPLAAWLRNLFRPGLCPNGTSDNARHRLRRSPPCNPSQVAASPSSSFADTKELGRHQYHAEEVHDPVSGRGRTSKLGGKQRAKWSVPVLAERGTLEESYCQIKGGARSTRARWDLSLIHI